MQIDPAGIAKAASPCVCDRLRAFRPDKAWIAGPTTSLSPGQTMAARQQDPFRSTNCAAGTSMRGLSGPAASLPAMPNDMAFDTVIADVSSIAAVSCKRYGLDHRVLRGYIAGISPVSRTAYRRRSWFDEGSEPEASALVFEQRRFLRTASRARAINIAVRADVACGGDTASGRPGLLFMRRWSR